MNKTKLFALTLIAMLLGACASDPDPIEIAKKRELDATVVAVDVASRRLVVRGPEGNQLMFGVGPDVRNLEQVEAGDIIRLSYYSGYLISMAEEGDAGTDGDIGASRAEEGQRPGGMVGATMRATVEILSTAEDGTAVSFRDPNGRVQSIDVIREDAREFVRKLDKGDLVDIRYSEAVAINVKPADGGS